MRLIFFSSGRRNENKVNQNTVWMVNNITLVYPEINGNSGTKSYVENTFNGLTSIGVTFDKIAVKKREIHLAGKPYFGILLQYLSSLTKSGKSKIVHALSPDVVIRGTNIVTVHDIIPFTNPDIYIKSYYDRIAYGLSLSRALKIDKILISTEVGREIFLRKTGIDEERVKVVYHSINHSKFFPENVNPFPDSNKINIVMVSDLNPRKRIDIIIKAIGGDDEINFYHIGPSQGWVNRRNELLRESEKYTNVKFIGPADDQSLRKYLTFADLFVFLSDNEGFGLPPIEAMACGTNVLVNDLPVFRETIGGVAFFCELSKFGKSDIMHAIQNRLPRDVLIEFSKRYSIEKYAKKLNEIYKSCI